MRYSPRNIKVACDHEGLTHVGGIHFFHEFVRVLQLRNFLATHLTYPRRNNRYHLSQMIMALLYPMVLGLDRLETASFLRSNGTFQYLTGLPSFPDPQTLRRFLLHAPHRFWEQIHRINDRLLQHFIHRPEHRSRLIFDLDSTVVTVFGHQDGAEVGYNPRYRGKRSYNALPLNFSVTAFPHQADDRGLLEFMAVVTRFKIGTEPLLTQAESRRETEELLNQFRILFPDTVVVRTALRGAVTYQLPMRIYVADSRFL